MVEVGAPKAALPGGWGWQIWEAPPSSGEGGGGLVLGEPAGQSSTMMRYLEGAQNSSAEAISIPPLTLASFSMGVAR